MRYRINDTEIKSENAAKPYCQKSKGVDDYLLAIKGKPKILDFGCGKLRYSDSLVKMGSDVTFVDSEIQLHRAQMVRGENLSVCNYVQKYYSNCRTVSYESLGQHDLRYDVITCTNVLSAIPCERTIVDVLAHIKRLLKDEGYVVFVNQHRSSYFKKFETGNKLLFGYLYEGRKGYSYYGIIDKHSIEKLLSSQSFEVINNWCVGESTFTEAKLKVS